MATDENRQAPVPGVQREPEEQAGPLLERQPGREGVGLELFQLWILGGGQ